MEIAITLLGLGYVILAVFFTYLSVDTFTEDEREKPLLILLLFIFAPLHALWVMLNHNNGDE